MIIKITPDKEKTKSILNLIKNRESFLSSMDIQKFSTIAAENYYEIIKELISILLLLDGFKATGENAHKDAIDYLSNYKEVNEAEIVLINDLRIKRNKSCYEGKEINPTYLSNNREKLLFIINKLKQIIKIKLQ